MMDRIRQLCSLQQLVDDDFVDDKPTDYDDKPTEYLYGDLELKINTRGMMVDGRCFLYNYLGTKNPQISVNMDIRLHNKSDACSKITHNLDRSTGKHRFRVSLAHSIESNLEIRFKLGKESGVAIIPFRDIDAGNELERWFPVSGRARGFLARMKELLHIKPHIQVQLKVKFTPCDENPLYKGGIGAEYALKESYFPLWPGGKVTLYQDAHCVKDPTQIPLENAMFKQGTCWEDICHAILDARHVVYIVGWAISHEVKLVREATKPLPEQGLWTLGDLLKYKSRQGVKVQLLVWNEYVDTGFGNVGGFMKTHAKETKSFFEENGESNVKCELAHRNEGGKPSYVQQKITNIIFSHHQKCVIVDENDKISAFIGGLDLCSGRYDTPEHRLYHDNTVFEDDFLNPTFQSRTKTYPREPWHDLHCKIEGPAAYDVLKNFEQRWHEATKKEIDDIFLNFDYPSSCVLLENDPERWNIQIFRSIDSGSVKEFSETSDAIEQDALIREENVVIDRSIQVAYIQAIRSAQHFIYIENQYFIGSLPNRNMGVNLIPLELAMKIASKIKSKERFCVYVVIPMWPEGDPTEKSIQKILHLQWQTMEMMYGIIAQEIKSAKLENTRPTDYLNFYCLGNRKKPDDSSSSEQDGESTLSHEYQRFMIYVHSKGMIVDDAYVILGSANINHRSMDGLRDTEIAMGSYQPNYTWTTKRKHPHGQIYGYRMSLWDEHFGSIDNRFEDPQTLECVKYVNDVAEENWKRFTDEQFYQLEGHILKYPIEVNDHGKVTAKRYYETFPDVGGKVLGTPKFYIPDKVLCAYMPRQSSVRARA